MSTSTQPHLRASSRRRVGALAGITSLLAAGAVGLSSPAQADDATTLTVVGTSDTFDSGLVDNVLKPGFEAYYQAQTGNKISFNYISKGTGAAIAYARAGSASALLVHAASLENQFVGDGYSEEQYGRAIFFGDYVLLGPKADPAGVLDAAKPSNDIVTAFEKIAAAGADGKARFVSRGGTPGTTVQEHAIWSLSDKTKVQTCDVSTANGGGTSPSTDTGACPAQINYPSWYKATGLTQGPNVTNADACDYSGDGDSNTNDCYVFTDKGTFQYLRSQNGIKNLQIVAEKNSPDARGGATELINSFHAYAVNPDKIKSDGKDAQLNTPAAISFLNWVTSPAGQTAVSNYLANDPDGAPFLKSASPDITYTSLPASVQNGSSLVFRGTVTNPVPGTPNLSGVPVALQSAPTSPAGSSLSTVATTTTNSRGEFIFYYKPDTTRRYGFSTDAISKVENSTLNPVFGDLLAPGAVTTASVPVVTTVTNVKAVNDSTKHVAITGQVTPKVAVAGPYLTLLVRKLGTTGAYTDLGRRALPVGTTKFSVAYSVPAGSYVYRVQYSYPPGFAPGASDGQKLTVR